MPEENTNPNWKSTHTKTTSGRIQKASAELYFSRRRVRRGLIFRATLPPAQLERNAPFHKLNWGHAWHGNNREEVTISQILGMGVGEGEIKLEQLKSFYPFPQRGKTSLLYIHFHVMLERLFSPTFDSSEINKSGLLCFLSITKFWTCHQTLCCFVHIIRSMFLSGLYACIFLVYLHPYILKIRDMDKNPKIQFEFIVLKWIISIHLCLNIKHTQDADTGPWPGQIFNQGPPVAVGDFWEKFFNVHLIRLILCSLYHRPQFLYLPFLLSISTLFSRRSILWH